MSEGVEEMCRHLPSIPKSLQGTKDAEVIWEMMIRRYPKAAPLLSEMEDVMERAEGLLQQLHSPFTQTAEQTSSLELDSTEESNHTPNMDLDPSEGFDSSTSDVNLLNVDSFSSPETEKPKDVVDEACGSWDISNLDDLRRSSSKSTTSSSSQEYATNFQDEEDNSILIDSPEISTPTEKLIDQPKKGTEEITSLEGWTKVAGSNTSTGTTRNVESEELITGSYSYFDSPTSQPIPKEKPSSYKTSTFQQPTSDTVPNVRNKSVLPVVAKATVSKNEADLKKGDHLDINPKPPPESSRDRGDNVLVNKEEKENLGIIEGSPILGNNEDTPEKILERYAIRCNLKVNYEAVEKGNGYRMKCSLLRYEASAWEKSQKRAKNDATLKLLRLLTSHQMEGELRDLPEFTREEMKAVVQIGMDNEPETAIRKLYKLCLEKGEDFPLYSVQKETSHKGLCHVAKCSALGLEAIGREIRGKIAMRTAADKVYEMYRRKSSLQDQ